MNLLNIGIRNSYKSTIPISTTVHAGFFANMQTDAAGPVFRKFTNNDLVLMAADGDYGRYCIFTPSNPVGTKFISGQFACGQFYKTAIFNGDDFITAGAYSTTMNSFWFKKTSTNSMSLSSVANSFLVYCGTVDISDTETLCIGGKSLPSNAISNQTKIAVTVDQASHYLGFQGTGNFPISAYGICATKLYDSRFLACGGYDGSFISSCYIGTRVSSSSIAWNPTTSLPTTIAQASIHTLPSGNVILIGGVKGYSNISNSIYLGTVDYSNATINWSLIYTLPEPMYLHASYFYNDKLFLAYGVGKNLAVIDNLHYL